MKKEARISGDCPLDGRPAGRNAPCTTESNRIHDLLTKKTAMEESMDDVYSSLVYASPFFLYLSFTPSSFLSYLQEKV